MNPIYKRIENTILLSLATLALVGCGPRLVADSETEESFSQYGDYSSGGVSTSGDFNCPASPNVLPHEDRVFDGSQRYTACAHRSATTKVRLNGYSSTEGNICVYPIQYLDSYHFVYKIGPGGGPLFACYNAQTLRTKDFDFQQTTFNGLAIVDQSDQAELSRCFTTGQGCPTYSIGQFR